MKTIKPTATAANRYLQGFVIGIAVPNVQIAGAGGNDKCHLYRPYAGGVASRLAAAIYVAMVTPILYDNSYSPNDSNLKYESYQHYG